MTNNEDLGVLVPATQDGRRSSSTLGRAVVADALREVDPAGALDAEREKNWRKGYVGHFRRLLESGVVSRDAALKIAADGLHAVHERMRYRGADGTETALADMATGSPRPPPGTVQIHGTGEPEPGFSLPVRGERLVGEALSHQLDVWSTAGVLEPSAADQIRTLLAHPDWLRLDGQTIVVLGAGAEMGPLAHLLRWGARVAALELPRPELWHGLITAATGAAGTLLAPVGDDSAGADAAAHAGLDVLSETAAATEWINHLDGALVLGNYVYADGVANLRLAAAVDALTLRLQDTRTDLALAFLGTPTDVFAVPADAVAQSMRAHRDRSTRAKLLAAPLRALSAGRLLRPQYPSGPQPGIHDALIPQQGPNYALAKRLHRWRATVARDAGSTVSMNIAPPTGTRSVVKNRALAAAYAEAHRFGVEVFEPATASTLMAGLLVADLHTGGGPSHGNPWQDEASGAVHGGLWRGPYQPRSALGLAAVMGYRAAKP
ncbi:MAG: hypothetical protein DLM58_13900 [Pseudonocardiales bacterium]|nr:MAG: hypothetical protein DLM58_13900 [Pseudonocardiales bacterium]